MAQPAWATVPASNYDMARLADIWNEAYEGYFYPVRWRDSDMAAWIRTGSVSLDRSRVLVTDGRPAGISLLGIRGRRGWCAGFGLSRRVRGLRLARPFFASHLEEIREFGLEEVRLEVLTRNHARKVYEQCGFTTFRNLAILGGEVDRQSLAACAHHFAVRGEVRVANDLAEVEEVWKEAHADNPPVWQREWPSLLAKDATLLASFARTDDGVACAIAHAAPNGLIVDDIALPADADVYLLSGLLNPLVPQGAGGLAIRVVNEPEPGMTLNCLLELGLSVSDRQYEMAWSAKLT